MSKKMKVSGLFALCLIMITGCSQKNSTTSNPSHFNSTNGSSIPSLPNESTNSSSSSNEPEPIPYYTYRFSMLIIQSSRKIRFKKENQLYLPKIIQKKRKLINIPINL